MAGDTCDKRLTFDRTMLDKTDYNNNSRQENRLNLAVDVRGVEPRLQMLGGRDRDARDHALPRHALKVV